MPCCGREGLTGEMKLWLINRRCPTAMIDRRRMRPVGVPDGRGGKLTRANNYTTPAETGGARTWRHHRTRLFFNKWRNFDDLKMSVVVFDIAENAVFLISDKNVANLRIIFAIFDSNYITRAQNGWIWTAPTFALICAYTRKSFAVAK